MKLATLSLSLKWLVFKSSWRLRQVLLRRQFSEQNLQEMSKQFYEAISKVRDWQKDDYRNYALKLIQTHSKNQRIFDAGCGDGWALAQLDLQEKIGIDFSKNLLLKAKNRNTDIQVVLASVDMLPIRDQIFDVVFSLDVLEHVLMPKKMLEESKRVARGMIVFTTDYDGIFVPSPRTQLLDNTPPLKILRKCRFQLMFFRLGKPTSIFKGLLFGSGVLAILIK